MKAWLLAAAVTTLARPTLAEVSARRVWLECDDGERKPAVLLESDTAWTWPNCKGSPKRVCSTENVCATVVGTRGCDVEELPCPENGTRLMLAQALLQVSQWPHDDNEVESLVTELRRDPEIAPLLRNYTRPYTPPVSWGARENEPPDAHPFGIWSYELSAAAGALALHRDSRLAFGTELGFGGVWTSGGSVPGGWASGYSHGFHVRAGVYSPQTRVVGFAGLDAYNVIGSFRASRWRVPSVLGVILPEAGLGFSPARSFALRWNAPFSALLSQNLALDVRTSSGVMYTTPAGKPDWFVGLTLGLLLRIPE